MIARKGKPLSKYPLVQRQTTIGRRPGNDIVPSSWSVSGSHALLIQDGAKVLLQDLGSRNGTFVDGTRIARMEQFELRGFGVIRIADFSLTVAAHRAAMAYEPTLVVRTSSSPASAQFKRLAGTSIGDVTVLTEVLTTLGDSGVCQVTCIRRVSEYAVCFASGSSQARLNGAPLGEVPVRLYDRDILELGQERLQFQADSH